MGSPFLVQAPLVGTLMEVTQAVRFPDGRLLVLAVGVGRFKVGGGNLPCTRAGSRIKNASAGEGPVSHYLLQLHDPTILSDMAARLSCLVTRSSAGS